MIQLILIFVIVPAAVGFDWSRRNGSNEVEIYRSSDTPEVRDRFSGNKDIL